MTVPLLSARELSGSPRQFLEAVGDVFTVFGPPAQDSGNLSYGVRAGGRRFFVKTTDPEATVYLDFPARVALLRNAVVLRSRCDHLLLPKLLNVIESNAGPVLIYEWVEGEPLRAAEDDATSAHARFRRLPPEEIYQVLESLYGLHLALAELGYVAADFYDGCLIYDFTASMLHVVDLDHYQPGPFTNEMGRMFGSSRFMAPEEFELGARIDEQTTVFNLGRAAALFLGDGSLAVNRFRGGAGLLEVVAQACQPNRADRHGSVADFVRAWRAAGA
ncbi:MAG: serine/threonine protein kinase [Gammaproteobacteria bacterium]|jgi:serine/threonine-protein kinase|nr:MAG: serine/threonine protein kinase [Gammaproteobacteria bacterium]